MKKIQILALLAILMFFVQTVPHMVAGFTDGMNDTYKGATIRWAEQYIPVVTAVEYTPEGVAKADSVLNRATGERLPAQVMDVAVPVKPTTGLKAVTIVALPVALFALYGIYTMLRVVFSVVHGNVFSRRNVRRMRIFAYSWLAIGICMEVEFWLTQQAAARQVDMGLYAIDPPTIFMGNDYDWLSYIMLALFTEIFAVGVRMKEEQDLTI